MSQLIGLFQSNLLKGFNPTYKVKYKRDILLHQLLYCWTIPVYLLSKAKKVPYTSRRMLAKLPKNSSF
ncbi:hypothetical protein AZH43_14065 [Acinetobacter pragensis]|uniref:Uncharacterized protein n=1 Tax=Acinetobacter pragensis TaxID=1806892 RepID=A0A151Y0A9_9GAMM|nr:hypothetical protein AZH43_14725 [Acinetobacter pragensis]KYQ71472.1 hypothetical protein AZH43_14065 [Acinetobacter pragensis]